MCDCYVFLVTALLALSITHASGYLIPEHSHPSNLHKRDTVDCGTWVMKCGGTSSGPSIENACNNACYFINIVKQGDYTATVRKNNDNPKNRAQSGCNVGSGNSRHSICTYMPNSQKFTDKIPLTDPTCDEFPMADWAQDDWKKDEIRNTLRCMERRENSAAGGQWLSFKHGTGDQPKRTCQGNMDQDNTDYTFKIEFDLDNTDPNHLPYCQNPIPPDVIDVGEFWMDRFSPDWGDNHFPLQTANDNLYVTGNNARRIYSLNQCRVDVFRQTGDEYHATYYDAGSNEKLGEAQGGLHNNGDKLILKPTLSTLLFTNLIVIRTGEMGDTGTRGSKIEFESAKLESGYNDPLSDFQFDTESTGKDARYTEATDPGGYCKVPNIEENEDGIYQSITCYYPCTF